MDGAWLQFVASGLTAGAIYALVALGFSIIYNASDAINFAQGEFVMIGGMTAVTLVAAGLPLWAAVPLAVLAAGVGRRCCSRSWRSSRRAGADTVTLIIITIGASLLLRGAAQVVWDKRVHALPAFSGDRADASRRRHRAAAEPVGAGRRGAGGARAVAGSSAARCSARRCAPPRYNPLAARLVGIHTRSVLLRQLRPGGGARCAGAAC